MEFEVLPYPKEGNVMPEAYKDFKVGSYVRIRKDNPESCYLSSKKLNRENAVFKIVEGPCKLLSGNYWIMLVQIKDGKKQIDRWMTCAGMELCDQPAKPEKTKVDFKDVGIDKDILVTQLDLLNKAQEFGFNFNEIRKVINKYLEVVTQ